MAAGERTTNTYMLSVSTLSVQQLQSKGFESELGDMGERIQAILATSPGHRRTLAAAGENGGRSKNEAAARLRPRRRRKAPAAPPTRGEISIGWSDLLGEISCSARRIRVAKGGHFGAKSSALGSAAPPQDADEELAALLDESGAEELPAAEAAEMSMEMSAEEADDDAAVPAEAVVLDENDALEHSASAKATPASGKLPLMPGATPRGGVSEAVEIAAEVADTPCVEKAMVEEATDALSWRSYRIDEAKVPASVLAAIWRRAVDPKHCTEEVEPLSRVPRMTVTRREVEQLPAVHDMQHWRSVKTKRREARKTFEESEKFPPLAEMMRSIFGEETPPQKQVHGLYAQMKALYSVEKRRSSATGFAGKSALADEARNEEELEIEAAATLQAAMDIEQEEEEAMMATRKKAFMGVMRKGRRGAFDEGQPWQRGNQPLAEIEEKMEERRLKNSCVSRVLEDSLQAGFDEAHVKKLGIAHQKVNDRAHRKVVRMHTQFVRKQGQLSARLTRRVQRLQMDFEETQDTKINSILPSVVAWEGSKRPSCASNAGRGGGTVLQYLQNHRHKAEQERQGHHAIYLQQVESFQGYLKLLADPNRSPERGELYLSECFRHVLAAGLITDNAFFTRVLHNLEPEDFEKTATVNLLAACCVSFSIDLRQYWEHLTQRSIKCLAPVPQTDEAKTWEDWAPWNGVRLDELVPTHVGTAALPAEEGADAPDTVMKPAEHPSTFEPIVPEDTSASDLNSRNQSDPLAQILKKFTLDSVLERYQLGRADRQGPDGKVRQDCDGAGEDPILRPSLTVATPTGSSSSTHEAASLFRGQPRSPQSSAAPASPNAPKGEKTAVKPSTPPPAPGSANFKRAGARKVTGVLARTRGMAEPLSEKPGAPDKDRPRAAAQKPSMSAIAEGPLLE